MKKILVVEDSAIVIKVLRHILGQSPLLQPLYADTFAAAQAIVEHEGEHLFAAIVDLNLPDAPNGEVVDYILSRKLPTIVLTGSLDNDRRRQLLAKGIVDYVSKEGRYSYTYVSKLLHRLIRNENIPILVVDDSTAGRKCVSALLRLHRYQVFEAQDGMQAIQCVLDNPQIKLMITDYNMPKMNGCDLVQNIRGKYEKTDLVIIGLSSDGEESLSARFIKSGANDFLRKPFNQEEFFCRISHNVDTLEMIEQLRDAANRDFYTGAYNRHYFFAQGKLLLEQAQTKNIPVAAVALDLDNFKEINHHYGNEMGDCVMQQVAVKLMALCDRFLVARADGQEFYLLLVGLDNDRACAFIERVRQIVSGEPLHINNNNISLTFSAGVSNQASQDFDGLMLRASECLDRAKEAGGDLVFGDE